MKWEEKRKGRGKKGPKWSRKKEGRKWGRRGVRGGKVERVDIAWPNLQLSLRDATFYIRTIYSGLSDDNFNVH